MHLRKKLPFMDMEPPLGYVPGLGRGATGFTTRSDIGPARDPSEILLEQAQQRLIANKGQQPEDDDEEDEKGSEEEFDEEYGYTGGLFNDVKWDEDDDEADRIYSAIDARADSRRKEKREARLKEELEKYRKERPKLQTQFADLKQNLSQVTEEDWDAIPDAADTKAKRLKHSSRSERFTRGTHSFAQQIISGSLGFNTSIGTATVIDPRGPSSGFQTSFQSGIETTRRDLTQFGDANRSMLGMKLGAAGDSVTGQTVVDPTGYISDMNSMTSVTTAVQGDWKAARDLVENLTQTNSSYGRGWVVAARLDEGVGKLHSARKKIMQATKMCPSDEEVWLEAVRLQLPENAPKVIAEALQNIPTSVKLWLKAVDLEKEAVGKKVAIRKALEAIPNSVRLWKIAVEMEEPDNAKILLSRAVECCPQSVDLWLALAHLEDYQNAKAVLNRARENIPTEKQIWIAAAKLEEANGNDSSVDKRIQMGVSSLKRNGVEINREEWIKSAIHCEHSGSVVTAQAIIRAVAPIGVEEEDRKHTWLEDADQCKRENAPECARAVYALATFRLSTKKSVWLQAAFHEREHGTSDSLEKLLAQAVKYCPQAEVLWLLRAKAKWNAKDVVGARSILGDAFLANPNSERIFLAAVKLENENQEYDKARILLKKARHSSNTDHVWMKSALFEWQQNNCKRALDLLEEGSRKFPKYSKLWMMKGHINEQLESFSEARKAYNDGIGFCPDSVPLWLLLARLDLKSGYNSKARAVLERGLVANPKNEELWLELITIETKVGNHAVALTKLTTALQECPKSGLLWAESIFLENRQQRKSRSVYALKQCDSVHVVLAVARLFWSERRIAKARNWFDRAVRMQPNLGDAWAFYYAFELQHGTPQQQRDLVKKCATAKPKYGRYWAPVAKDVKNHRLSTPKLLALTVTQLPSLQ